MPLNIRFIKNIKHVTVNRIDPVPGINFVLYTHGFILSVTDFFMLVNLILYLRLKLLLSFALHKKYVDEIETESNRK